MKQIKKFIPHVLILVTFLFLGAAPGFAQPAQAPAPAPAQKAVSKARAAHKAPARVVGEGKVLGPKETLSGTLSIADTTQNLVIVTGANGIPYSFRVTRATKISVGGQKATIDELANQVNQQITVEFVPRSGGNFASSVSVGG